MEGVCSMDIESTTDSLKELCCTIQKLVRVPSDVVLHRTKCCILAKSYAVGLQAVFERVEKFRLLRSREDYCESTLTIVLEEFRLLRSCEDYCRSSLSPILRELLHAMEQGKGFIEKCLQGKDWLKTTVVLALSTEVVDVCLHDLIWCICVIYQAVEQVLTSSEGRTCLADLKRKRDEIYTRLKTLWADASDEQDLAILLDALNQKLAENESLDESEFHLAKFMLQKLSSRNLAHGSADERLPGCLWVDFREFRNRDLIGEGASASIFMVNWWGKALVLKQFASVGYKDMFSRESAIQARLRHPNLVQFICCTENPVKDRCCLVMELMDMDLHSLIHQQMKDGRETPLSLVTAVDIMLQIAKGMEYLHRLRIIHRDLKSYNVLVSKPDCLDDLGNCRLRAKVADFGMAKTKYQGALFTTPQVGTTFWRAPEVFKTTSDDSEDQSNAQYTMKADVYSFGMVSYEILTGKIPFDGCIRAELHQRLLTGERPRLPSSCPAYLTSYIKRCWQGDPSKRPDFTQILRTLRRLKRYFLTSADPFSSFFLSFSSQSCGLIEEEGDSEIIGRNLVPLSRKVVLRSMALFFKEPLYQTLIKVQTIQQEEEHNVQVHNKEQLMPERTSWFARAINFLSKIRVVSPDLGYQLPNPNVELLPDLRSLTLPVFMSLTVKQLDAATNNFRECIDGSDVFFRGTLADGSEVAVKLIHGDADSFNNILSKARCEAYKLSNFHHHRNIVRVIDVCYDEKRVMVVYKYMSRGDLTSNLFGQRHPNLSWPQRYKIVTGLASALEYLHCDRKVVHNDLSPFNVMLDEDCTAYIRGFGFAVDLNVMYAASDAKRLTAGVPGYVAPEILLSTQTVSPAADVYAFGVIALQVASGRKTSELTELNVWQLHKAGRLLDAGDKSLRLDGDLEENQMKCVLQLGLACTQTYPRPSMANVGKVLSGKLPPLIPATRTKMF